MDGWLGQEVTATEVCADIYIIRSLQSHSVPGAARLISKGSEKELLL